MQPVRILVGLAFVSLLAPACKQPEGPCLARGATAHVSGNHGHDADIPADHIRRSVGGTYPLKGGEHEHVFVLRDEDMKQLAAGNAIKTRSSSVKAHLHEVEVHCQ